MKKITVEELYEKLVDFYEDKFPHNPSGVLQFHIDRIVREGKLKEDAVIDLSKQAGIELAENITRKFPESSVEPPQKPGSLKPMCKWGVILIAFNVLLLIPIPLPHSGFPLSLAVFGWIGLLISAAGLGTMVAGLRFYIIGRKELSIHLKGCGPLLIFFGFALTASSLWYLFWTIMLAWYSLFVSLAWYGLAIMTGILLIIDGAKLGVKAPSMKKTIDLETPKKLSRDLIAKYREQYPHNPKGVLEWHINKKIKEGKTRKQAIEELTKESGQSKIS